TTGRSFCNIMRSKTVFEEIVDHRRRIWNHRRTRRRRTCIRVAKSYPKTVLRKRIIEQLLFNLFEPPRQKVRFVFYDTGKPIYFNNFVIRVITKLEPKMVSDQVLKNIKFR